MREIKFRVWSSRYESFLWDDALRDFIADSNISVNADDETIDLGCFSGNALEQFTGIKDKNGKMIFEGDIVRFFDLDGSVYPIGFNTHRAAFEAYDKDRFLGHTGYALSGIRPDYFEVVGNIHENPELLK
jgi:uncharacterized phage protein (TIGR01671 family)